MNRSLPQLLEKYYGFSEFRPGQEEVIESIMAGRDTLALMPTGGGKSLCYQLPALALDGTTVVVSPLIALMKDQVDVLVQRGVAGSFINSSLADEEIKNRTKDLLKGRIKILYVAPERLAAGFAENLKKVPISLIAIDEAHCVSTWGHDFRPDYLQIKEYIEVLPNRPIVTAFTATATPEVKRDIIRRLGLNEPNTYVRGFDRPNLRFFTRPGLNEHQRDREVLRLVRSLEKPGIVYVGKRDKAEELAEFLTKQGVPAEPYHAGLKPDDRTRIQESFMNDQVPVIVATIAFGMGVDKSDVRFVIHAGMPGSLEGYYQEAGRAGRDGHLAYCILLHSGEDSGLQHYFIQKNYDDAVAGGKPLPEATAVRVLKYQKLNKMKEYVTAGQCRRRMILDYFGDESARVTDNCQGCDYCLNFEWPKSAEDASQGAVNQNKRFHVGFGNTEITPSTPPYFKGETIDIFYDLPATVIHTVELLKRGLSVNDIAKERQIKETTVINHLIQYYATGGEIDIGSFLPEGKEQTVLKALSQAGDITKLSSIKAKCPDDITYEDIKWVMAKLQRVKLS